MCLPPRISRLAVDPVRSSRSGSRPVVKSRQALSAAPGVSCYRHWAASAGKIAYGCSTAKRSHSFGVKPLFTDFVSHSHTDTVVCRRHVEALAGIARKVLPTPSKHRPSTPLFSWSPAFTGVSSAHTSRHQPNDGSLHSLPPFLLEKRAGPSS